MTEEMHVSLPEPIAPERGHWRKMLGTLLGLSTLGYMLQVLPPVNMQQVGGGPPVPEICGDPAKITYFNVNLTAGTGNTELIALNGANIIYICSYVLQTSGADTPQFITGQGSACATNETDIQTFKATADGDGLVENGGGAVIFKTPAGYAFCLERTSSVAAYGRIGYVRQDAPA